VTQSAEPPEGRESSWPGGRRAGVPATPVTGQDQEIVSAVQRGDAGAFARFIERYHRLLLDYARRAGVPSADRDELVGELLDDVALQLMTRGAPLPDNPRQYLLSALRHRLLNSKRARGRRDRVVSEAARDAYGDAGAPGAVDMAAGCSEANIRASRGPAWESTRLPPVLERLSARLDESLRDDERQLLVAVAENIPQREIAEWLGVSYVVARKRLERLRARLTDVAMRYTNSLEPDDARELQRFFRRCRSRIGASLLSKGPDDPLTREA
jgi:RNA polymerase sigma factor (sigma-70 family)